MAYKGEKAKLLACIPLLKTNSKRIIRPDENRIAHLERLLSEQASEIVSLRKLLQEERLKNSDLEQQIQEMKDFLSDYGLMWVGGPRPQDPTFENGPSDFQFFMQRISELNKLAEQNKISFEKDEKGIAKVSHQKPILLTLFNDGFSLDGGVLRHYGVPANVDFLKDICDGFFPSEFRAEFPDGVYFKVEDKRVNSFHGKGRRVVESEKSSRSIDTNQHGDGDGILKVRINGKPDLVININPGDKIGEIRQIIASNLHFTNFDLCDPVTGYEYLEQSTVNDNYLYPRGLIALMVKN